MQAQAWCQPAEAVRGSRGMEEIMRPESSGADEVMVELRRHGACRCGGGFAPDGLSWLWCQNVAPCTRSMGLDAPGESPCRRSCRWDDGSISGRRFVCWGRHFGALTLPHRVLWVKTLSISWTSDGGAFGVVPSLEASSLETHLSL